MSHQKLMGAREAVKRFVRDGDSVFVGGFGNLYPFSLAHEVIRQEKRNLTLVKHSPARKFSLLSSTHFTALLVTTERSASRISS